MGIACSKSSTPPALAPASMATVRAATSRSSGGRAACHEGSPPPAPPPRFAARGRGRAAPLLGGGETNTWPRRYLHADHQGSIIAIANDYGNAQRINAYDAWGIRNAGDWGRFG